MKSKYVPFKNYVIAFLTIAVILFLSVYFYKWYKVYDEEQVRVSYLVKTNTVSMQINNIDDLDTILSEAPNEYFIYISYTHDKDVYNLEKKLKKVIDDYGINDVVYYVNATKLKNDDNFIKSLNEKINTNLVSSIPAIIYIKNNEVVNVIQDKKKLINANDLEKILKNSGLEKLSQ